MVTLLILGFIALWQTHLSWHMCTMMYFDTIRWHCIVIVTAHGPHRHLFSHWCGITVVSSSWTGMLLCCFVNDDWGGGGWWLWAALARCCKWYGWRKRMGGQLLEPPALFGECKYDHMFRDQRPVATSIWSVLDWLLNIHKVKQPATILTWNRGNCNQKKDWTAVQSSSVLYIFSPVKWTLKHYLSLKLNHSSRHHLICRVKGFFGWSWLPYDFPKELFLNKFCYASNEGWPFGIIHLSLVWSWQNR